MIDEVYELGLDRAERSNKKIDGLKASRIGTVAEASIWGYLRMRATRRYFPMTRSTLIESYRVFLDEWKRYQFLDKNNRGEDVPTVMTGMPLPIEAKASSCKPTAYNHYLATRPPSGESSQRNQTVAKLMDWQIWLENSFYCAIYADTSKDPDYPPCTFLGWATRYELLKEFAETDGCAKLNKKFGEGYPVIGKHWTTINRPDKLYQFLNCL